MNKTFVDSDIILDFLKKGILSRKNISPPAFVFHFGIRFSLDDLNFLKSTVLKTTQNEVVREKHKIDIHSFTEKLIDMNFLLTDVVCEIVCHAKISFVDFCKVSDHSGY